MRDWHRFVRAHAGGPLTAAAVDDLAAHVREIHDASRAEGRPDDEAVALALAALAGRRRQFPPLHQGRAATVRPHWLGRWLNDLGQDLRFSIRGLRRDRGFAVFAVLITAFGIGASTVVFSLVSALLMRPLPLSEPDRLVWVPNEAWSTQVANFLDLRDRSRSVTDLAGWFSGYGTGDWQLTGGGEPERVTGVPVTQNLFALLGVSPALGRGFTAEESQQPARLPQAVILGHAFWQRRFDANPRVVGAALTLNGRQVTIVGVLPASFDFAGMFAPGSRVDVFIPWPLTDETNRRGNTMSIVGRLAPGVTVGGAHAELAALGRQLEREHPVPERNPVAPNLVALAEHVNGDSRPALLVLAYAVAVVMTIVCANLSSLQIARVASRQREMATRSALGAGRLRLVRQLLTEIIAVSSCGALLGLALAVAGTRAVSRLTAFDLPLLASVQIDGTALSFIVVAAILTGVLFGLLPALQAPGVGVAAALKDGGRGVIGGRRHAAARQSLVISELALACALVIAAGLILRSLMRALDVDLGFQPAHTAVVRVDPGIRFPGLGEQNVYLDDLLQRTRSVPGVVAAGVIDVLPFDSDRSWQVGAVGQVYPKGHHPEAFIRVVSDGYFEAAGIRVHAGRGFTEQDRQASEPVAIVNETLARTLWPGQDPIGRMLTQNGGRRVVGVVAGIRHDALEHAGGSEMYLPMRQTGDYPAMQLVTRTTLPADAFAGALRGTVRAVDPNLPIGDIRSLQQLVDRAASPRRFLVLLLGGFAVFALLLASLGIYAVVSYAVQQRTQEFGIRIALGASPGELRYRVLSGTVRLAACGLVLGVGVARALSPLLESVLFDVSPADPLIYAGAGTVLILVAAVAGGVPAWRASRIDPITALRSL